MGRGINKISTIFERFLFQYMALKCKTKLISNTFLKIDLFSLSFFVLVIPTHKLRRNQNLRIVKLSYYIFSSLVTFCFRNYLPHSLEKKPREFFERFFFWLEKSLYKNIFAKSDNFWSIFRSIKHTIPILSYRVFFYKIVSSQN